MKPNVRLATRDDVERALLVVEQSDKDASNLLRNYIASLESALRVAELEADEEPGSWLWSQDDLLDEEAIAASLRRVKVRLMERIRANVTESD